MSSNIRIPKICEFCNNAFIAKTTTTRYCSDNCFKKAYKARKREEKINNAFEVEKEKNSLKTGPFGSSLKKEFYVQKGYKIYGQEQVIADDFEY